MLYAMAAMVLSKLVSNSLRMVDLMRFIMKLGTGFEKGIDTYMRHLMPYSGGGGDPSPGLPYAMVWRATAPSASDAGAKSHRIRIWNVSASIKPST